MSAGRVRIAFIASTLLVVALTVFRLAWEVNTPTDFLWNFGHDDGLFMRLGANIASGQWLGPYNQMTLAKGPGYPAFLALVIASGVPVSVWHALFAIAAIGIAAMAVHRLTGSRVAALAFFLLLILLPLPTSFQPAFHRVIRDQIYWGQTLIFYSTLAVLLFAPPGRRSARLGLAVSCGAVLGWAWMTREEGVWLAPGAALLGAGAVAEWLYGKRPLWPAVGAMGAVAIGVAAIMVPVMATNLFAYGSFSVVDFKERNFERALAGLQSVEDKDRVPRVPVSEKTLGLVAQTSPSFRPLADAMKPKGPLNGWREAACRVHPDICGQIPGSLFMWVLRDAGWLNGFYSSPDAASVGFGKIADEIEDACARHVLTCNSSIISFMPPMTEEQWSSLPDYIARTIRHISLWNPASFAVPPSPPGGETFFLRWRQMNYPKVFAPADTRVVMAGWFHDAASGEWPSLRVEDAAHSDATISVQRIPSAGLAALFHDSAATLNRFQIVHRCTSGCTLVASFRDGSRMAFDTPPGTPTHLFQGDRKFYVDSNGSDVFGPDARSVAALRISTALTRLYSVLFPTTLGIGLVCYVLAAGLDLRKRRVTSLVIVATAAWCAVLTRAVLIALVDLSSFFAIHMLYLAPAVPMAGLAAVLSICAVIRRLRPASERHDGTMPAFEKQ